MGHQVQIENFITTKIEEYRLESWKTERQDIACCTSNSGKQSIVSKLYFFNRRIELFWNAISLSGCYFVC